MPYVPKPLQRSADASRGRAGARDWARGLASIAVAAVLVYFALGLAADLTAAHIPDRWETRLFAWSASLADADAESEETRRAHAVLDRLLAQGGTRGLDYRIGLLDFPQPNAVALPGGFIGVTRGLLDALESEIGLAFVIAHELGHHQHRHTLRRLGRTLFIQLAVAASGFGDGFGLLEGGVLAAELANARSDEHEADAFALALVQRSYGTTEGALEFLELVQDQDADASRWSAMLRTHPLTRDRLEALRDPRDR